ncbi:MAG: Rossmann-like and DUF2520 domain-containing protein [Actinomycetota bacterium]|jgi:predicted short-subunit dehydrogenase-like oxidoreductase (DUF2520 family)
MDIAIVGAGTVGTAVGIAWAGVGHRIVAVAGRQATVSRAATWLPGVPVLPIAEAVSDADLVAIGVPDEALPAVVSTVASAVPRGVDVLHLSGARGLEVLEPVVEAGARPLAVHPLQTFADVAGGLEALPGCAVAVTAADDDGFVLGERLARDLGGRPFRLPDAQRPLYHAAAVFASNYLVAVSGAAEVLFSHAGVPEALAAMRPLQEATLANVHRLGPRAALTGPAVRGDAGTIDRNLSAIAAADPELLAPYVALCRAAIMVAGDRLAAPARPAIEEVLARWS